MCEVCLKPSCAYGEKCGICDEALSCTPESDGSVSCAEIEQLMRDMDERIVSRDANDPDNGYSIGVMECADLVEELLNKMKQND